MDPGRNRPTPPQLNINSLVSPSSDNLRRRSLTPITRSFPATIHSLPSYTSSNSPFTDPVPEPELSRGWRALLVARVVGYILTILSLAVTFAISAMFLATSIANCESCGGGDEVGPKLTCPCEHRWDVSAASCSRGREV